MATVRKALFWSFAERYASMIVGMAGSMVLARLLKPHEVGIYSLCATLTTVATIVRDFGISEYLIQERELTKDKLRAAYGLAFLTAWSIGIILFVLRYPAAAFYQEPQLVSVIGVLCLNFFLLPLATPTFALLNRELQFRKVFIVQLSSNVVQQSMAVWLAWKGFSAMSLAWSSVAGIVTTVLILVAMRPGDSWLLPSFKEAGQVMRFGSMFMGSRIVETLTRNGHEFLLAKQMGFEAVGLFSRAYGMIELFQSNVANAIQRVATPAFAAEHRSGGDMATSYAQGTAVFTALAWPFFGFVALMAGPVIELLFGKAWLEAAPVATMLALTCFPSYLVALAPNLLSATGQIRRRLHVTAVLLPCHLLAVFLASRFGMVAVAACWMGTNSLGMFMYLRHIRAVLNVPISDFLRPCLGSAVIAAVSIAVQWSCELLLSQMGIEWLRLLLTVLAGALAWLAAVFLLPTLVGRQIRQVLMSLRKRQPR